MALTKITGQVINTATDVTVGVLTVTDTLAVGGTVSVGGTLTYEDVTNVDSVGLITARNGIKVGSGITLSKDGDVFFTGIATGNGITINSGGVNVGGALTVTTSHAQVGIFTATVNGANLRLVDNDTESKFRTVDGRLHLHADVQDAVAESEIKFYIDNQIKGFISAGSSFSLGNDADTYISRADANTLAVTTGGSEAVRIVSDGKTGINTVTPRGRLHVLQGGSGFDYNTNGDLIVENNNTSTIQILAPSTHSSRLVFGDEGNGVVGRVSYDHLHNSMRFHTQNNERVTLMGNGNLGIGTTSASDFLHVNATAQQGQGILIESKDTAYGQITFDSNKTSADQNLAKIVSKWNGTVIGELIFKTGDDTTNKDDGMITFRTSYDGTLAERMRLTESGQLCIGTNGNAASADNMLEIESTGTSIIKLNNTDDGVAQLSLCNTGSSNGHIKQENGVMNFLIANNAYMYLNGSDLGIGESSPDHRLHVNSGSTNGVATFESTDGYAHLYVRDNGTHATGTYFGVQGDNFRWVTHNGSSSNERLRLTSAGNATLTGSLTQNSSDIRLKENIQPITNSLEKVKSLSGFTFNWNKTAQDIGFKGEEHDELQVGLSAQDVEKIQPEVVKPAPIDNNFKTIQYEKLVPLLVEAIKEQQEQIEILKTEISALKGG